MSNWKATKIELNTRIKSLAGLPNRSLVRNAWQMSTDEFWNYQATAFKSVYEFARNRVPFYQKNLNDYPVLSSRDDNVLEILSQFPVLFKQTLRANNSNFLPSPLLPLTMFHTTSGTSGTPLRLSETLGEKGFFQAINEEFFLRICGTRYPRSLYLTGFMTPSPNSEELYWRDILFGNVALSIYSLNSRNRARIIELINNLKPQLIWGYASAVHQLAILLGDRTFLSKDRCVAVVTSETLQPDWRANIENSICRKVFNYYSSQEYCHLAVECLEGQMHINPLVGIVEILDKYDRPVKEGKLGRVVVTGLLRKSMPLIRYELGDAAISTSYVSNCSCGLKWPIIAQVEGRLENLVKTRDGRRIGMLGYSVLKDLPGVKESQIVQVDYEKFICNIVKFEADSVENEYLEHLIYEQLIKRLQTNVQIEFRYLSSISRRGSRAKFSAVVVDFEQRDIQNYSEAVV
ncbi:phenylacetate--CoA ligase family protein [Phormidium sp. LEGE 05292]|uniref:phenylacetate--CoA ligase family protein n=1 Tax=[Phormidium] sp. LEGE 05292 TaxID=767427 RepID=UPI001882F70F|nr:phenylacetate--CoA ligase family protein [Phormidium sp. LEGE 05292]MBE9223915.1 phenylacetate--CoA ligase family protein [Phormidium sp. LEGE 05292]